MKDLGGMGLRQLIVNRSIPAPNARDKWLGGNALRPLNDLIEEHGLEAVEAAVDLVDPGVMSPLRYRDQLEGLMALPDERRTAPPAPAATTELEASEHPVVRQQRMRDEAEAQSGAGTALTAEENRAQVQALRPRVTAMGQDGAEDGEDREAFA